MAGGKIRKSDVIEDKKIIKALQAIKDKIDSSVESLKKFVDQAKKINKALSGAKTFKEFNEQAVKAEKNIKDLTDEERRLIKSTKELAFQTSAAGKKQAVATEQTRRARKANREYAQSQLAATKNTNTFGKAIGSFLFKANFLANVMSNVTSKIAQFAKKIITDGIRGVISFDAAITDVRAVAQATEEQFNQLRKSAIALGQSTKFTSTQVALLQKEFAKLGFTSGEIIKLQESTLQLATATGAELAPAAKVVGGALRAFGKNVRDARSVTATLAIATTKSALAFEDYETILSTVAPVARAYNFSLEDTIALLGQLKNANFDSSKASTATRNILLNLADANGALAKALGGNVTTLEDMVEGLIQLRNEGVDLATTLELTDKRSVAAFNTFLIGAENALVLKDQITDVNDELDEMVNTQLSSLENKITLLNSAWQGFIQATVDVNNGTDTAKGGVDTLTTALQGLTKGINIENEKLGEFGKTMKSLTNPLLRAIRFTSFWAGVMEKLGLSTEDTTDEFEGLSRVIQEGGFDDLVVDLGLLRVAQDNANKEIKVAVPILEAINEEIKTLQKLQLAATTEEQVKAYALEIKALQDKKSELVTVIDLEKESLESRKKTLEVIRQAIKTREAFSDDPISDKAFLESMILTDSQIDEAVNDAEELAEGMKVIAEDLAKAQEKIRDKELKDIAQFEKVKFELAKSFGIAAFDFLSALTDSKLENQQAQANEELTILDKRQARELDNASLTADQRLAIEDRFAAQRLIIEERSQEESLKLRRQAARIEKASALFSIALDTAKGVLKYGSNPITASLVPFIIGLGLAQAAVVAATPIPQFAKGTDSSPAGAAWVGEKGSELMIDSSGNIGLSPDKATLMNLNKGTQIIPADATDRILASFMGGVQPGYMADLKETNHLLKSIRNKPVASSTMTPAGILTAVNKGNTTLKKLDKYFS